MATDPDTMSLAGLFELYDALATAADATLQVADLARSETRERCHEIALDAIRRKNEVRTRLVARLELADRARTERREESLLDRETAKDHP